MTRHAPSSAHHLVHEAYAAFNARDLDAALEHLHPDVEWPNVLEGTTMRGRDQVAAYWRRQWATGDPHVEPVRIDEEDDRHLVVAVHQIVRDLAGHVVSERFVEHVFLVERGQIKRMDIRATEPGRHATSLDA